MESEKVKEIKKALEDHSIEKLKYQDGIKIKEIDFFSILTLINELESENDTLHTNLCEWRKENQQLKDRIENQRMTKKGFRYEILPSTENSPRRVKDHNEYCTLYNRLAELEDKIENGTLVEFPFCVFDKKKNKEANCYKIALKEDWATVHEQFAQAMYQKEANTRKEIVVKIFDALYQWLDLENTEKCGFATIQKFDFLNKFRELYQQFGIEIKE